MQEGIEEDLDHQQGGGQGHAADNTAAEWWFPECRDCECCKSSSMVVNVSQPTMGSVLVPDQDKGRHLLQADLLLEPGEGGNQSANSFNHQVDADLGTIAGSLMNRRS